MAKVGLAKVGLSHNNKQRDAQHKRPQRTTVRRSVIHPSRHVPQRTVAMQLLARRCDSPFNCRDAGLEHDQTKCRRALCKHVSSTRQHAANAKYQTPTQHSLKRSPNECADAKFTTKLVGRPRLRKHWRKHRVSPASCPCNSEFANAPNFLVSCS